MSANRSGNFNLALTDLYRAMGTVCVDLVHTPGCQTLDLAQGWLTAAESYMFISHTDSRHQLVPDRVCSTAAFVSCFSRLSADHVQGPQAAKNAKGGA